MKFTDTAANTLKNILVNFQKMEDASLHLYPPFFYANI